MCAFMNFGIFTFIHYFSKMIPAVPNRAFIFCLSSWVMRMQASEKVSCKTCQRNNQRGDTQFRFKCCGRVHSYQPVGRSVPKFVDCSTFLLDKTPERGQNTMWVKQSIDSFLLFISLLWPHSANWMHLFPHVQLPGDISICVILVTGPAVELSLDDFSLNGQLSGHCKPKCVTWSVLSFITV